MRDATLSDLTKRLDRLERENRWSKRGVLLALLPALALLVIAQAPPRTRVVEGEKFVLRGADGKVRAILGAQQTGAGVPSSLDPRGYSESFESYGLHLYGADGRYRAGLAQSLPGDGGGEIRLLDGATTSWAALSVGPGIVDLALEATRQKPEEKERDYAERAKRPQSAKTRDDRIKALMPKRLPDSRAARLLISENYSFLSLEEQDTPRAVLGRTTLERPTGVVEERPLGSVVLFDKDGKVIWKAP